MSVKQKSNETFDAPNMKGINLEFVDSLNDLLGSLDFLYVEA